MVAEKVPIAALAAEVRSSMREMRPGGRMLGGRTSGGIIGLGDGRGPGGAGVGDGLGDGDGPGGTGVGLGEGDGLGGVISSPLTKYQSVVTGVMLEPLPRRTKYEKVPTVLRPGENGTTIGGFNHQ
jgi:hypothetical protein